MIDTTELEKRINELKDSPEGVKKFNKYTNQTLLEVLSEYLEAIKIRNQEILDHKGELVINGTEIVRLEDVVDDGDDFCWVYNRWVGLHNKESNLGRFEASCVGQHTRLKGFIPDKRYNRLVTVWNLNNETKTI